MIVMSCSVLSLYLSATKTRKLVWWTVYWKDIQHGSSEDVTDVRQIIPSDILDMLEIFSLLMLSQDVKFQHLEIESRTQASNPQFLPSWEKQANGLWPLPPSPSFGKLCCVFFWNFVTKSPFIMALKVFQKNSKFGGAVVPWWTKSIFQIWACILKVIKLCDVVASTVNWWFPNPWILFQSANLSKLLVKCKQGVLLMLNCWQCQTQEERAAKSWLDQRNV